MDYEPITYYPWPWSVFKFLSSLDYFYLHPISDNRRASPAAGPRHRLSARQPRRGEAAVGRGQEEDRRRGGHRRATTKVPTL